MRKPGFTVNSGQMDRVRLGRVLGRGARLAARTAFEALDAATSPDSVTSRDTSSAARPTSIPEILRPARLPGSDGRPAKQQQARTTSSPAQVASRLASPMQRGLSQAVRSVGALEPVKRASRAVSLEISGSFFALFALTFAAGAWRFAPEMRLGGSGLYRFVACCLVAVMFGWFAISNFAKARRL